MDENPSSGVNSRLADWCGLDPKYEFRKPRGIYAIVSRMTLVAGKKYLGAFGGLWEAGERGMSYQGGEPIFEVYLVIRYPCTHTNERYFEVGLGSVKELRLIIN